MIGEFSFNDIGQGCFYTGQLFPKGFYISNFSFVYDCGTLSQREKLNSRINRFKKSLNDDKIDVLFISHIDDDHINGIHELLKDIKCGSIYLPYLTPIERLTVAVRHEKNDTFNYDDYISFLKSPHDYILNSENSEIDKIIYIKGNTDRNIEQSSKVEKPTFTETLELIDNLEPNTDTTEPVPSEVEFKKGNGIIKISSCWEFYLFHEPAGELEIDSFIAKISEYDPGITKNLSQEQLVCILNDEDKLKKLRDLFKEKFKNLNKACLVIQHKPLSYKYAHIYKYQNFWSTRHYFNCEYSCCKRRNSFSSRPNSNNDGGITLLTGDIGLNQIENSAYIKNHLDKVVVFQVPHHGSNTGWNNSKLRLLNSKGQTTAVICFGFGNKYGHPKPQVLEDLEQENFDIKFCNQYENFSYLFRLEY
ncbi:MAG TPA: hypothetical protein PLZ43_15090 [bacterium]|nr:hypothetical protein [bacterium]